MIIHNVCCYRCSNKKSHKVFSENVILELTTMQFYHIDGLRTVLKKSKLRTRCIIINSNCTRMPINCLYHKQFYSIKMLFWDTKKVKCIIKYTYMYFEQYNLHVHRVMLDTKNYLNFYIDFVSRQTQLDLIKDHRHIRRIYTLIGASKKIHTFEFIRQISQFNFSYFGFPPSRHIKIQWN